MKRIFIGQFVSKNESLLDKRISQAGNNYQLKFIKMVEPVISISIVPVFFNPNLISESNLNIFKLSSKIKNKIINVFITNFKSFLIVKKIEN